MNKHNIKELAEKLERWKNVNLDDVKLEDVDEITDIKIERRKPSNERILDFIMKTKNPYIFKVNGKLVRIRFSETDKTADDCLTKVLENLYRWMKKINGGKNESYNYKAIVGNINCWRL